ncbi:fatty-acid peroxygenase [Geodermatophilus bullaregiensis]|uniref:cytochrome P450 n=1 Tax=Geodermatophilus bullaregiensis TaxID=1564160 RepID=UPI00195E7A01|nr:cytochrome P450 [Geodermatophilus bullaregiensis]MBM7805288.1 fatty-acid peroxygenase [Geodermatophilus bullaregiensis]
MPRLENGLALLTKGYAWMPDLRRARGLRAAGTRLGGLPAVAVEGPEAARFLYDEDHVHRAHAIPEPVQGTLFGKGAVHTLDGEAHRVRKAMFVSVLMDPAAVEALVQRACADWDTAAREWATRPEVVLFDESARVIAGAVTRWAGVPLTRDEVPALARDLLAMVDSFASAGPRHWRARRARGRREDWLAGIVEQVRAGEDVAPPGSVLQVVAAHRDADGGLLDPRVAAVELLNVIRPTTAVAWFTAFSGHALARWPQHRARLAGADAAFAEAWAHEVRRFYPFAPFIGGRAPQRLEFGGQTIPRNSMVLLDVYGQGHDPDLWEDPYTFRPERFLGREIGEFDLVPQGGGDPRTNHRCPGEQITVALLAALAPQLARAPFEIPADQDLTISLRRIPARPASGVVLRPTAR